VTEHSQDSEWVQRELGLALAQQKENSSYRPVIIPIYAKQAAWRATGMRPQSFRVRDFETGRLRDEPFDLHSVRGIDKYANPASDSDEQLALFLRPFILTSRVDFFDGTAFDDSDVWQLYEQLFPENERDDPADIVTWVTETDVGEERPLILKSGEKISNRLDSRFFILVLAGRAIGLGFFTYDYANNLIYGNYIAVHQCWRGGNIARVFFDRAMETLGALFPNHRGMAFEVEKFDKERVEQIIGDLERSRSWGTKIKDEQAEIRKFLRVTWYYKLNCFFFSDENTREPLTCRSPCLDPRQPKGSREALEEDYWIMWYGRRGAPPLDLSETGQLWNRVIDAIYIEILAKSLVTSHPAFGKDYWAYSKALVAGGMAAISSTDVTFSKYLDRHDNPLLARWMKLEIDLPI
jgi:hypothetical protein